MFPVKVRMLFEAGAPSGGERAVTVIVSLYNYQQHIAETLDSILAQTHSDIELIVVNDNSNDKSAAAALKWFKAKGSRLSHAVLISHVENYGLAAARNTAFAAASSEFVMVMDADNIAYSTAVERLLNACINADVEAAYSQLEMFEDEADIGEAYIWDPERLAKGNYIDAMALVRKRAWVAVGGYDYFEVTGWEDYNMWCDFIDHGFEAIFVPQILCRYRVHAQSMLRSDTNVNASLVRSEMLFRHPWLELR